MRFPVLLELSPSCANCNVVATGQCAAVEKPKEEGFRVMRYILSAAV